METKGFYIYGGTTGRGSQGFHVENVQGGASISYKNRNPIRFTIEGEPFAAKGFHVHAGEEGKRREMGGGGGVKDARLFTIFVLAVALGNLGIMFALLFRSPSCICRPLI